MGSLTAVSVFSKEMTRHYGVKLTVSAKVASNGVNAGVLINQIQAVAGVSYTGPKDGTGKINPSKSQCSEIANTAEERAEALYSEKQKENPPKKMTQGEIYGIGN